MVNGRRSPATSTRMTAASPSYWANSVHLLGAAAASSPSPFQSAFRPDDDRRRRRRASIRSRNRRQRPGTSPFVDRAVPRQSSTTWPLEEVSGDARRSSTPKEKKTKTVRAASPAPQRTPYKYDFDELNLTPATLDYSTHVPLSRPMDYRFAPTTMAPNGYARTRSAPTATPGYNHRPSRLHRVYPEDYNLPTTSHPPPLSSSHHRSGNGYLRSNGHLRTVNGGYNNGNGVGYSDNMANNVTKYPTPPSLNNDWSFLAGKERELGASTPPNVRLLREINQRAKITEKSLVYIKILGFVHLLLGLALISLEWAKLLLVWPYLDLPERKLALAMRAFYPLYIIAVGTTAMASGIVNRKGATQLMMVTIIAMLAPFFVLPGSAPFVTSVLEAMQVARAKDVLPGDDDRLGASGLGSVSNISPQMIQSAMHNRFIKYLHAETLNGGGHPLGISDLSRVSVGNMNTLQHLLTAFSALSLFHCLVAVATLVVGWRLLHVQ